MSYHIEKRRRICVQCLQNTLDQNKNGKKIDIFTGWSRARRRPTSFPIPGIAVPIHYTSSISVKRENLELHDLFFVVLRSFYDDHGVKQEQRIGQHDNTKLIYDPSLDESYTYGFRDLKYL